MAEGVLGLGTGAASLNNDLIDQLKEAERASTVAPIETYIEDIEGEGGESEKIQEIVDKANLLLETLKPFDLFVTGGQTAFDSKTANTTGDSVVFDAVDASIINEGTTSVNISKLAQKDVFQTNKFSDATSTIPTSDTPAIMTLSQAGRPVYQSDITISADATVDASGTGIITIDEKIFNVSDTMTYSELVELINEDEDLSAKITLSGRLSITNSDETSTLDITSTALSTSMGLSLGEKYSSDDISYEDLAKNINANSNYIASVELVGKDEFGVDENRIVIKSVESGLDNKITITQANFDLGLSDEANNTVKAQNLEATVDGIDYNVSSNILIVDGGLKITAVEEGASTISINKDTSIIEPALQDFVTIYNELVSLVDEELYSSESTIDDKATLRTMMSSIKDTLFASYGTEDNLNIFNFGFEIDKSGILSLDSEKFNEVVETDIDSLKSLFIGVAEDRGLGTQLKEYVDTLDGFEGLLSTYQDSMASRKEALEEEREKAIEALDSKYESLSAQFAAYNTIINQFETQFSGLQLMIEQSVASS